MKNSTCAKISSAPVRTIRAIGLLVSLIVLATSTHGATASQAALGASRPGANTNRDENTERRGVTGPSVMTITDVVAGRNHTCILLNSGAAKCWGANDSGQLGGGTNSDRSSPVFVAGISTATSIASGINHSCVLLSGGGVQCWGSGELGQLGDGTTANRNTPSRVTSLDGIAMAPATDAYHTCAVLTTGMMRCWGFNQPAPLGTGAYSKPQSSAPVTSYAVTDTVVSATGS